MGTGTDAGADAGPGAGMEAAADTSAPDAGADAAPEATAVCTPTSCGIRSVCMAGAACVSAQRVFVTSATYNAALGGYAGADSTCSGVASAAGLGGTWKAWISDSASCPSARFVHASRPYALLDGTVVASGWSALTSGSLANGIARDEAGNLVSGNVEVWTATNPDGTFAGDGCSSFSSSSHSAPFAAGGIAGDSKGSWTDVYLQFCDRDVRLYCFEQ
jgi:hypothetical protein